MKLKCQLIGFRYFSQNGYKRVQSGHSWCLDVAFFVFFYALAAVSRGGKTGITIPVDHIVHGGTPDSTILGASSLPL